MPIEPPDPLLPPDFMAVVNDPTVEWRRDHVVNANGHDLWCRVKDGVWTWAFFADDSARISDTDFEKLRGAKDLQADGGFTTRDERHASLHPNIHRDAKLWADVVFI